MSCPVKTLIVLVGAGLMLAGAALLSAADGAVPAEGIGTVDGARAAPVGLAANGPTPPDSVDMNRGRRLTGLLLAGDADSLVSLMASDYVAALGGRSGVERAVSQIRNGAGNETEVVTEAMYPAMEVSHYYRVSRFSGVPGRTVTVHWGWRDDGRIVHLEARPTPRPAATGHEDYRTKTRLELPFEGEWYVFWGGREPWQNYHVRAPDQRFAYDFVVLRDGSSHTGNGAENADYHCFGRPVLAPAPGRVVTVVDSVEDNVPGQMNRDVPPGNHVVIDHGDGEYSLLAHFRRGSIEVEEGGRVERGQMLGACGNSGNSSEPHVHYHLQTGAAFGQGSGLPAQFRSYRADGKRVERGEPVRGQVVLPVRDGGSRGAVEGERDR